MTYNPYEEQTAVEWVKQRFTGKTGEYVEGMANHGIGYVILESGVEFKTKFIIAAYRRPIIKARKDSQELCSNFEIKKLDKVLN